MAANKYGEESENEDQLSKKLRQLDLQYYFRSPYLWGLIVATLCAMIFFIYPVGSGDWKSWSTGPLHSGHAMLNDNCSACHTKSFQVVDDASCTACHKVSDHGSAANRIPVAHNAEHLALRRCADCHLEHKTRQDFLPAESRLCAECHSDLKAVVSKPVYESFSDLASHSEFAVTIDSRRVRLNDRSNLKDPNPVKFNHAVHLKPGLKGPEGKVDLQCQACHEFKHDKPQGNFVTFEKNCRSCHELSFDDRLPESKVPHGDTAAVYQYLLGEYSKLLGYSLPERLNLDNRRAIPGKSEVAVSRDQPVLVEAVVEEARASENLLFTKTSCQLCHEVTQKNDATQWSSRFEISKPRIPERWLDKSRFSHNAHEIVSCESCHEGVRKLKDTSDVMIPGIDNCRTCHVEEGQAGLVPSTCTTCHIYHVSESFPDAQKKSLKELVDNLSARR